jgi:glycosyltransferase involved in cell wall biosynthesis
VRRKAESDGKVTARDPALRHIINFCAETYVSLGRRLGSVLVPKMPNVRARRWKSYRRAVRVMLNVAVAMPKYSLWPAEGSLILCVDGQAREILSKAQGGICVDPENATALVAAIAKFVRRSPTRHVLGGNGRRYITEHLSREPLATVYSNILEKLVLNGNQHHRS